MTFLTFINSIGPIIITIVELGHTDLLFLTSKINE